MLQDGLAVLALGPGHEGADHFGLGVGQAFGPAGAHDAGQAQGALGCGQGHPLGDHAAHGGPNDMGLRHTQCVQHTHGVQRHVVERIGRAQGDAQLQLDRFPQQVGHAFVVKFLRQADVAVVVPDDAVTRRHQRIHQLQRPGHQLHAQAHDEHHHRPGAAGVFHFDVDAVCFDFHSCIRLSCMRCRPIWLLKVV